MSDQPQPMSPDDPRLTAYLLGELSPEDTTAFETELTKHPELKTHLDGLRETTSLLSEAFDNEPTPALSAAQRSEILSAAAVARSPQIQENPMKPKSSRGATWIVVAAVAALCVVLAVVFQPPNQDSSDNEQLAMAEAKSAAEKAKLDAEYSGKAAEVVYFENEEARARVSGRRDDLESFTANDSNFSPIITDEGKSDVDLAMKPREEAPEGEAAPGSRFNRRFEGDLKASKESSVSRGGKAHKDVVEHLKKQEQKLKPIVQSEIRLSTGAALPRPTASPNPDPAAPVAPFATPGEPGQSVKKAPQVAGKPTDKREELARGFAPVGGGAPLGWRKANLEWDDANWMLDFKNDAPDSGNESYQHIVENDFIRPRGEQALSTFSIDVDTASYSNVRRFLQHGQRPPADAVRIEELVNYFKYDYATPTNEDPFAVHTEVAICPWKPEHHLVRFGLKGREIAKEQRPLSNLVFLVDVSGSMSNRNKLPLVKQALTMLANQMNENDRISLVTYASSAAVRLQSTSGEQKSDIISAIQNLKAGGSTNGEGGIHLAYAEAIQNFIENGSNRVILCTDGDFNVGVSNNDELVTLIQDKAKKSRVFLSVFGFGMGNLKDQKLEMLADKGNGHYAYIDNAREARKVFVEELTGTLYTIAKDVKIQVEFNPAHVGAYRLIGYENRKLANQDFNDDTKDAGEIGAGHTVTALYEIIPVDKMPALAEDIDRLKYQAVPEAKDGKPSPEMLTLKLRYKQPDEDVSVKRVFTVKSPKKRSEASADTEWQAAVAAFGMVLRGSKHRGQADLRLVRELAMGSRGDDPTGRRREFLDLVRTTERLAGGPQAAVPTPKKISAEDAKKSAAVEGKYQNLLKTIAVPNDLQNYGGFNDYGYWEGDNYAGHDDLPKAHWVYVYPNWYLWSKTAE